MYVPFTAKAVIEGNQDAKNILIQLKGIMIGNGLLVTDDQNLYGDTQTSYYVNRNLFDYRTSFALKNQCQRDPSSYTCTMARTQVKSVVDMINVYNIYGYCFSTDSTQEEYKSSLNNVIIIN
jgi:hypothetical protein